MLVPGKLLVLRGDRAGVPVATASLAEGAEVTALEKTKLKKENSEGDSNDASNDKNKNVARAVVALTLPNGDAFAFRFATLEAANDETRSEWETVVGLEMHVQVGANTKLFSGCVTVSPLEPPPPPGANAPARARGVCFKFFSSLKLGWGKITKREIERETLRGLSRDDDDDENDRALRGEESKRTC